MTKVHLKALTKSRKITIRRYTADDRILEEVYGSCVDARVARRSVHRCSTKEHATREISERVAWRSEMEEVRIGHCLLRTNYE